MSYGSLVREKMDVLDPSDDSFPLSYYTDPLQKIVEGENANLANGYPLKAVSFFLVRFQISTVRWH